MDSSRADSTLQGSTDHPGSGGASTATPNEPPLPAGMPDEPPPVERLQELLGPVPAVPEGTPVPTGPEQAELFEAMRDSLPEAVRAGKMRRQLREFRAFCEAEGWAPYQVAMYCIWQAVRDGKHADAFTMAMQMMPYSMPKLNATPIGVGGQPGGAITIRWGDGDEVSS